MSAVAETLLDGKQKEELCGKINQIPMSASSATKKTNIDTTIRVLYDRAVTKGG